jgi:hypothetical protein
MSGKPLNIDYFNLNLTIADNGNGTKGEFYKPRMVVPDAAQDNDDINDLMEDIFRMSFTLI